MSDRNATLVTLEPCDVFLTRGAGFVSRAIRVFTRRFGESRTKVNHVGIIVGEGTMVTAMAIEALVKVRKHPLGRYARKLDTAVAVYRPINLTEGEETAIVAKALSYEGDKYGIVKIAAHFVDWTLQGAYVFRRLTRMDDYPICSWLVAHAFASGGKDFGCEPGAATPDDIWDFVTTNPDKYVQVHPLVPIGMNESAATAQ
ncbi:MAG: hypothetical protein U9N79_04835 [Actinomycetota bacterium]|nr:hypothetical protein [Actinomycetota bacterium]